jgi:prepilin-type processing-associated H-X9-DG protein
MHRRANVFVLAAIVLVGGLLVPTGVVRVRDEANRIGCANHLKELGQAVANYEGQYGRPPTATVAEQSLPPERRLSWLVEMPQFVEQIVPPPYDTTKPWDYEENQPRWYHCDCRGTEVEAYWGDWPLCLCPSNPNRAAPGTPSLTHYVGIAGMGSDAASRPASDSAIGFFGYDRPLHREQIKKGLSHTLMVVETGLGNGPWTAGGYPTVRGLDPEGPPYLGKGGQFGGAHRGGANTLFGDGSVRFLGEGTSPPAFEAMATLAGGD